MTEPQKQIEVALLVEQLNTNQSEYDTILLNEDSYQLRKDLRGKMRDLRLEIIRIKSLPLAL